MLGHDSFDNLAVTSNQSAQESRKTGSNVEHEERKKERKKERANITTVRKLTGCDPCLGPAPRAPSSGWLDIPLASWEQAQLFWY
jgi:hypothetical protein